MTDSYLYIRNDTTTRKDQINLPENLPSTDLLSFVQPNRVLEGINELYENLVTRQPAVNESGQRTQYLRDDGMKSREFSIYGILDKSEATNSVNKIIKFRTNLMRSTLHPHGRIGFKSGNSSNFDVDPDATASTPATKGLMIGRTEIGYTGTLIRRLTFKMTLYFGGTHETVTTI